jgi:non-heme chloroperoxidase
MIQHRSSGAGGVTLHLSEHGDSSGKPILFIHGWSQSELCWMKQYEASELSEFRPLGLDLRGHGMSERPSSPEDYTNGNVWAEDRQTCRSGVILTE